MRGKVHVTGKFWNYPLTYTISNSRVDSKSDYFSGEYSQYLCFSVFCSTNKLVSDRNKHLWSEEQQKTHDLIKSLKKLKTLRTKKEYTPKLIWRTIQKYKNRLQRNKDKILFIRESLYVEKFRKDNIK